MMKSNWWKVLLAVAVLLGLGGLIYRVWETRQA